MQNNLKQKAKKKNQESIDSNSTLHNWTNIFYANEQQHSNKCKEEEKNKQTNTIFTIFLIDNNKKL